MAFRDPQPIALSRQSVLLVTAVGVGLIALSYILGVQVGKASANLRKPEARSVDDQLKAMPEPLMEQLKYFHPTEPGETPKPAPAPAATPSPAPPAPPRAETKAEVKAEVKPEPKLETKAEPKPDAGGKWTLQLVATPQKAEAERVAARAKAAGFPARVVLEDKAWKVRLTRAAPKEAADAAAEKLRAAGFKPFAVKSE